MENFKKCPYCSEEILAVAKKCKHCGEWVKDVSTEETSYDNDSKLTQEKQLNQPYQYAIWMILLCYAAICFSMIDNIYAFDIKKGYGKFKLIIDIARFIPEYVSMLCSTVLWIILFWNLKNYLGQKQNGQSGLFITLTILQGILCLFNLLTDEDNGVLIVLSFLCTITYCVIMLIIGIRLSKTVIKAAFITYAIAIIPVTMISMALDDGIWGALLVIALDIYLLWSIKSEFDVEIQEENNE
jgi:hypothetical protein